MSSVLCSLVGSHSRVHITFRSCIPLGSSWWWRFLRHFLFSMTFTVLRSMGQVFCIMACNWDLSDVFLIARVGCGCRGGRPQRWSLIFIMSYQRFIRSRWHITADTDLDHLAELLCTGLPTPCPFRLVWKKLTLCHPHLRSGELHSSSLSTEYPPTLFEILLHGTCVSIPFIYVCSHQI